MTTAKEAREVLEDEIQDYADNYGDERTMPHHWPSMPLGALDAYAAAVAAETEARIAKRLRGAFGKVGDWDGKSLDDLVTEVGDLVDRHDGVYDEEHDAKVAAETEARVRAEIAEALEAASKAIEARAPPMADLDDAWALSYWADKIAGRDPMKRSMVRYE